MVTIGTNAGGGGLLSISTNRNYSLHPPPPFNAMVILTVAIESNLVYKSILKFIIFMCLDPSSALSMMLCDPTHPRMQVCRT